MRDLSSDEFKSLSGLDRLSKIHHYILPKSKARLSEEVKDVYHKYMFSSIIRYISDSERIDSMAKVYEVEDYEALLEVAGTESQGRLSTFDLVSGDSIPNFYAVDIRDSLVSLRDYQDKMLYVNFWGYLVQALHQKYTGIK